jgi:hypothetical protein
LLKVKNKQLNKMDNFDLRKFLAEGRLLKENLVDFEGNDIYQEIKSYMKRYYKMDVPMDVIKDWADYYFPNRKDEDGIEYEFETTAREDFLDHLEDLKDSNASDEDKELQKQIDIQAKAARRITPRTRDLAMAKGLSMDDYFDSIDEGKILKEEEASIADFLNANIEEFKRKVANPRSKFEIIGDKKVATAGPDSESGIDVSFDKAHMLELFPASDPFNKVKETEIAGRKIYYNNYL